MSNNDTLENQFNLPSAVTPYIGPADVLFESFSTGRRLAGSLLVLSGESANSAEINREFNATLEAGGYEDLCFKPGAVRQLLKELPSFEAVFEGQGRKRRIIGFDPTLEGQDYLAPAAAHVGGLALEHSVAPVDLVGRWVDYTKNPQSPSPPYSRLALYFRLLTEKPEQTMPVGRLAEETGLAPNTVHRHNTALLRSKIAFSEGTHAHEYGSYALVTPNMPHQDEIVEALKATNWGTLKYNLAVASLGVLKAGEVEGTPIRSIWKQLLNNPDTKDLFRSKSGHKQREQLDSVIGWLVQHGIVVCTEPPQTKIEAVGLTTTGRSLVRQYIDILDQSLDRDSRFSQAGKWIGTVIRHSRGDMGWLLAADFTLGEVTIRRPIKSRQSQLDAVFGNNMARPPLPTGVLARGMGTRAHTTSRILGQLSCVTGSKEGRNKFWVPNDGFAIS